MAPPGPGSVTQMLTVFATLQAAPGRRDELVAALEAGFPAVEAEEGTLRELLDDRCPQPLRGAHPDSLEAA